MSKFKIGDKVKVVNESDDFYNKVGTILEKSKSIWYDWRVVFEDGYSTVYCNRELELVEDKPKFKVGDLVECVESIPSDLSIGVVYTVVGISNELSPPHPFVEYPLLKIKNTGGATNWYSATRFKLYEPKTKLKTTSELSEIELQRLEMIRSYSDSIKKAGGCPERFIEDINKMTVSEMVDALAQNGVRFTYKGK